MENTEDHRRHFRLAHRAKVQLGNPNETITGYTKDISDSGLYIFGVFNHSVSVGEILQVLLLDIEDALPKPVSVKRIDPGKGIAVEFIES